MISHIRTEGFKGFDIDEAVPNKVIYTGMNKSGKSTRSWAIALALYGHIPFSTSGKKPSDILNSYGNDSLVVAVKIGDSEFARKFSRNKKGVVSQYLQVNKVRASAAQFAVALEKAGNPSIADVANFMTQSEAKKIDTLFELFPCEELQEFESGIDKAKEDISRLNKKISGVESTVQRLTDSKANYQAPSGTLPQVQSDLKAVESQIKDLEEQIKQAEIEEAKAQAVKESEENQVVVDHQIPPEDTDPNSFSNRVIAASNSEDQSLIKKPMFSKHHLNPVDSIQRIINAMQETGCKACAALIIAKQELKKYV